jgi:hypothetical protein
VEGEGGGVKSPWRERGTEEDGWEPRKGAASEDVGARRRQEEDWTAAANPSSGERCGWRHM